MNGVYCYCVQIAHFGRQEFEDRTRSSHGRRRLRMPCREHHRLPGGRGETHRSLYVVLVSRVFIAGTFLFSVITLLKPDITAVSCALKLIMGFLLVSCSVVLATNGLPLCCVSGDLQKLIAVVYFHPVS